MFDRDREWDALVRFATDEQPGATLGVVSGRRRQGKSFLLEALCQEAGGFYFSAQEATKAESLSLIGEALTRHLDLVAPFTPTDWPAVIDVLLRIGRERPVPVVIDEFPYLVQASPALPSMLQAAYAPRRAERVESRARLLLCGSAMSFMGGLLSGNAPLRGRAALDLPVATFDFRLAARFWGLSDPRLALLVHAVVGGTPAYRTEMIRGDTPEDLEDFDAWVVRAVLSPGSPIFLEARYLLAEEPDLRDGALYHSVLSAIAEGNSGRGGIASFVGRKSNELSHPLTVLEDAGLIARELDAFRGNRTDFRITEPLLTFYHAIMRPFWPQLLRAVNTERIWQRARQRFIANVVGPHFERICREWTLYFAEDRFGDWPSQVTAGTLNDPANRTSHEVDVVAVGHVDGAKAPLLAIGEVKWGEVMGAGHLERLRRIRDLVARGDKYDTRGTHLVCYSAAGFTEELMRERERGEVVLVGPGDLYGG
ncbi:AAA family ATPase [Sinosporangium siamense]|uniref:ATPase AAA n=1 Tax=Sinosporangium siamense TaxID=1367973 RepID=A0A919RD32_9ACTN|nr:ATP-binding protein [Sinosporangium siamense]GII90239.1 ATPase AAA [Sinosporangium siamense]